MFGISQAKLERTVKSIADYTGLHYVKDEDDEIELTITSDDKEPHSFSLQGQINHLVTRLEAEREKTALVYSELQMLLDHLNLEVVTLPQNKVIRAKPLPEGAVTSINYGKRVSRPSRAEQAKNATSEGKPWQEAKAKNEG